MENKKREPTSLYLKKENIVILKDNNVNPSKLIDQIIQSYIEKQFHKNLQNSIDEILEDIDDE
jgi:hypothetical protein